MIDLKPAVITGCIVHKIGNIQAEENCFYSKAEVMMNEAETNELKKILCKPFVSTLQAHQFVHETDLLQNPLNVLVTDIFTNANELTSASKKITQYLYRFANDYSIKTGELFFILLDNITTEAGVTNGMAIVKMDGNTKFIKTLETSQNVEMFFDKGIMSKNIEKAVLILNDDFEEGFYVYPFEKNVGETNYWNRYFLQCKARTDDFRQTNVLLNTFREYVMDELPTDTFSKKEKIDLVQNSMNYMVEHNDAVSVEDFISKQLQEPQHQEDYKASLQVYVQDNDVELQKTFAASKDALQYQRKKFRSIIKLDKNFHIYVHSNDDLIERGADDKGKFYKVYFNEEA
jgi:hypothetical protein